MAALTINLTTAQVVNAIESGLEEVDEINKFLTRHNYTNVGLAGVEAMYFAMMDRISQLENTITGAVYVLDEKAPELKDEKRLDFLRLIASDVEENRNAPEPDYGDED